MPLSAGAVIFTPTKRLQCRGFGPSEKRRGRRGSCARGCGEREHPASMEGSLTQMSQSKRGEGGDTGPVPGPLTEQDEERHLSLENTLKLPGGRASPGHRRPAPTPVFCTTGGRASGRGALVHRDSCQSLGRARSSKSHGATKPQMPTGPSSQATRCQEPETPENEDSALKSKSAFIVKN